MTKIRIAQGSEIMQINETYYKSAIKTIDLIFGIIRSLKKSNKTEKLLDYLKEIENESDIRLGLKLADELNISVPSIDKERKSNSYWEGVRDMVRVVIKSFKSDQDLGKLVVFMKNSRHSLLAKISEEDMINPLETIVRREDYFSRKDPIEIERVSHSKPEISPHLIDKSIPDITLDNKHNVDFYQDDPVELTDEEKNEEKRQHMEKALLEEEIRKGDPETDLELEKALRKSLKILRDENEEALETN